MKDTIPEYSDQPEIPVETEVEAEDRTLDLPEVWWASDIANIENPVLQGDAIKEAERIVDSERELERRVKSGEIKPLTAELDYVHQVMPRKAKAATRVGLASVGLTGDDLVETANQPERLLAGDDRLDKIEKAVFEQAAENGPEESKDKADEMRRDEKLSPEAHDLIGRQVRQARRKLAEEE